MEIKKIGLEEFEKFLSKWDSVTKILNREYGLNVKFLSEVEFNDGGVKIYYKKG